MAGMAKGIQITVRDLETGESETREISDDYMVICAGNRYLAHTDAHMNGTHVLTIKVDRGGIAASADED
jgi:hypothetical protein